MVKTARPLSDPRATVVGAGVVVDVDALARVLTAEAGERVDSEHDAARIREQLVTAGILPQDARVPAEAMSVLAVFARRIAAMTPAVLATADRRSVGWNTGAGGDVSPAVRGMVLGTPLYQAASDDAHVRGELARAAIVYAHHASWRYATETMNVVGEFSDPIGWPWLGERQPQWLPPASVREGLIQAAAMLTAEVDRLDRITCRARERAAFVDALPATPDRGVTGGLLDHARVCSTCATELRMWNDCRESDVALDRLCGRGRVLARPVTAAP